MNKKTSGNNNWLYSSIVKDHFFNPRNYLTGEEAKAFKADGGGEIGSPACGDMIKMWIKVNPKTKKITQCKWQTFGCASAMASTSMLSVIVTENGGMSLSEAQKISPQDIIVRLGGLPQIKKHCSVLGDKALQAAIEDYKKKQAE